VFGTYISFSRVWDIFKNHRDAKKEGRVQGGSVLERIKKELEGLSPQDQLELIEGLVSKLRKNHLLTKEIADWDDLYGLGRGLWGEDAQEYVHSLREDRA
jgi:hypothetical protein